MIRQDTIERTLERPIAVYPKQCLEHNSLDTGQEGQCYRYSTAPAWMRRRMDACRFEEDVAAR